MRQNAYVKDLGFEAMLILHIFWGVGVQNWGKPADKILERFIESFFTF